MPVEARAGELLALPAGEVAVLDRQLRQFRGPPGHGRPVELDQLAHQHVAGPAVADDMVTREDKHVVILG